MKMMLFAQFAILTTQLTLKVLRKPGLVVRDDVDNGSIINVSDISVCQQRKQSLYVVPVSSVKTKLHLRLQGSSYLMSKFTVFINHINHSI